MKTLSAVLFLLLACMVATAQAGQFTARVIAVLDDDTVLVVRNSSHPVKVRLADIDAPERKQLDGIASKKSPSELVLHQQVSLNTQETDIYGRLVAYITVDGKSVNEEQVRRGLWGKYNGANAMTQAACYRNTSHAVASKTCSRGCGRLHVW